MKDLGIALGLTDVDTGLPNELSYQKRAIRNEILIKMTTNGSQI